MDKLIALLRFAYHVFNGRLDVIGGRRCHTTLRRHRAFAFDDRGDQCVGTLFDSRFPFHLIAQLRVHVVVAGSAPLVVNRLAVRCRNLTDAQQRGHRRNAYYRESHACHPFKLKKIYTNRSPTFLPAGPQNPPRHIFQSKYL
jgi:hypothetical protein